MTTSVRGALEDAVIALLQPLRQSGKVRAIRPYNGELSAGEPAEVMIALNGLAPGILVQTSSGAYRGIQVQRRRVRRDIDVMLYLVSVSQSTREERTRGAGQIYELEDRILELLIGVKPDLGTNEVACGVLEPVGIEVRAHEPHVCIWRQQWRITAEADLLEAPAQNVVEVLGSLNAPSDEDNAADPLVQVSNLITV